MTAIVRYLHYSSSNYTILDIDLQATHALPLVSHARGEAK